MSDASNRTHDRILEATKTIKEQWPATFNPGRVEVSRVRSKPGSRTPLPVAELNTRDSAWRDMRSWAQLVMEERDLTRGPDSSEAPDLAHFLARHAEWLSRHEAGRDCADELARHAKALEDLAKGHHVKRYQIGPCPEQTITDDGIDQIPCTGGLWALMNQGDVLLPAHVQCDGPQGHSWSPSEWASLGRRVTGLSPQGAERLINRLGGYRAG